MHAYVWDRYYGICLAKYQHTDVVNSVAFNPRDSEMLVTTSDDYTIKVTHRKRIHVHQIQPYRFKKIFKFIDLEIGGPMPGIECYRNKKSCWVSQVKWMEENQWTLIGMGILTFKMIFKRQIVIVLNELKQEKQNIQAQPRERFLFWKND